ncbi:hypothetical protein DFQ27_002514 [Actinomortierella ambigua]|uniref:AMP-activated protein kinase glycogen-binding domain-containing protein n=1 Tax=Actinomortierella ambigua TaxID=1343610 RepID=A0A9P6QAP5_9FUNG|nr:hypothetical protein DFQ27_002514 [Actinomortierella ambigua]
MASEHDIYLKWPHPVPEGVQVYIAGTFKVPGHGPWEKLPMSYSALNQCWEVHLDVQEVEHHHHLPEDEIPVTPSTEDCHSVHSSHSSHSTQSSHTKDDAAAPTPAPAPAPAPAHRESRTARFFGRAKKDAPTPIAAAASVSAAYRHEPLRKTYHYLYKFIVGDDWQCDWDKHHVQDESGNWNNELTVELVEQAPILPSVPASPSTEAPARTKPHGHSRTPSIRSIQSVQLATVDEDKLLPEEGPFAAIQEEEQQQQQQQQPSPPPPPPAQPAQPTNVSHDSTADAADATPTVSVSQRRKSTSARRGARTRDTFEAVMIFDERDDLSDGEGRSRLITDDDDDDDDDGLSDEDEPMPQQEPDRVNELLLHAAEVDKQQQDEQQQQQQHHDHPQTAEEDAAAAVTPSFTTTDAASAVSVVTANAADNEPQLQSLGVQDEKKEAQEDKLAQPIEPHPQDEPQDDLHTDAAASPLPAAASAAAAPVANDTSSSTSYAPATVDASPTSSPLVSHDTADANDDKNRESTDDHAAALLSAEEEEEEEEEKETQAALLAAAAVAAAGVVTTPPMSRTTAPQGRRRSYAEIVATQPTKPFMLQEAVDPEVRPSHVPGRSSTAPPPSTTAESSSSAAAIGAGVGSRFSEESTDAKEPAVVMSRGYYAPSPPLTPPLMGHSLEDSPPCSTLTSEDEGEEHEEDEEQQHAGSSSYAPMTPQSVKHASPKAMSLTHSKETSEASHFTTTSQREEEEEEEEEEVLEQEKQRGASGALFDPRGFDDKAPVRLPSLLWSLTKTTVVVSATVVLLTFGYGRRRSGE